MRVIKKEIVFLAIYFFLSGVFLAVFQQFFPHEKTQINMAISFFLSQVLFPIIIGFLFYKKFDTQKCRSFFSYCVTGFGGSLAASVPIVLLFLLGGIVLNFFSDGVSYSFLGIIPFVFLRALYITLFFILGVSVSKIAYRIISARQVSLPDK
ncbi:MAG TPA: hypothetical protein DCY48_03010 [Candidatus Magasanikbacteria bacterium]|nr:MAG: hypothetical protein A3I74_05240 [Candidatus Magasanikbacteria bacterium RIFCSPLOWO2_02_FULL_47_16]OGH79419.1 MAG: hypothetical protein A3C10_05075 [Candidatus Magasanikbacteria bacterium RIFCSPHIGHO2_02_FULL_48_18]OGH83112.1 MAG: hypothetical protein A3G08_01790 [Candidatus Magasanikbacteria bacterium RIFCSPLOWO2_12_FULL_47_9b]HAZ28719.1 hypothetical protein [Candidatus Magasanikbacteria bacterium]